uniref:Phospholipid-transporting ATPase n=1 Tax=Arcella intermedia TaxID=1963864 RepID=A0A6B2KXQ5_9EUKA
MRGVRLRNTKWCYAVVVYAGKSTKLMLNQIAPPSKFSKTEWKINKITVFVFCLILLLTIACTIGSVVQEKLHFRWYVPATSSVDWLEVFGAYFVLLSFWIPITLFVNMEIIKVAQAGFMMADDKMKLDGEPMRVKNSNLNDELSKISYIFSDKTGTLTQNLMVFSKASIAGKKYDDAGSGQLKKVRKTSPEVLEFLLHMALNHDVLPEEAQTPEEMPNFQAPTPDEIALVKGAYCNGVQVRGRTTNGLFVRNGSKAQPELFDILDTLEFSSERKRSSVLVKTPDGRYIMYMKGADSAILPRLSQSVKQKHVAKVQDHLTKYSIEGLRTLIFARKEITEEEYQKFHKKYVAAQAALSDRALKMEAVMNDMEQDFELQGCTAIEDKLQVGVPWAIDYFIKAGIKVWMITGDKQETAENIARSCKLTAAKTHLTRVVKGTSIQHTKDMLGTAAKDVKEHPKVTLIIDGQSLVYALDESLKPDFLGVGQLCETVVCCRCDPLQKAQVVQMMKRGTGKLTLSIGDGANDVSMLQEAHVGVGIWGKEGTQAARNSDYAIRQFSHLPRLIAVHGRYNMSRNALLIQFSFYKNIVMFGAHFWFGIFNLFSGQTYFDDWVMALFNEAMTSLGPLAMAFFEKDLHEHLIMKHPQVYTELRDGLYLTARTFGTWLLSALWHGIVIFFVIFLIPDTIRPNGQNSDMWVLSTISVLCGVIVVVLRGALSTRHFVPHSHAAYWFSITFDVFGLLFLESQLITAFPRYYKVMDMTFTTGYLWFIILLAVMACLVPDVAVMYFARQVFPKNYQIVQEMGVVNKDSYKDEEEAVNEKVEPENPTPQEQRDTNLSATE